MRNDQPTTGHSQLATDHRADPLGVHAYLGVTQSNCPYCHEEPHHAAARQRTEAEQAALDVPERAPFTSDEARALIVAGVERTTVGTIRPTGGVP